MEGFTVGQVMQVGAWGLALGTAFFSFFGIKAERDFFLVIGLICCVIGNVVFSWFLIDQEGKHNETFIMFYFLLTLAALYGLYRQLDQYRLYGLFDPDEEDEDAAPPATATAAAGAPAAAAGTSLTDASRRQGGASGASSAVAAAPVNAEAAARRARLEERIKEYREKMIADGQLPAPIAGTGTGSAAGAKAAASSAAASGAAGSASGPEGAAKDGVHKRK